MRPALKIKIELDGLALKTKAWEGQVEEIEDMLLDAIDLLRQGYREGQCRDSLGNTALWYEIVDSDERPLRGRRQ